MRAVAVEAAERAALLDQDVADPALGHFRARTAEIVELISELVRLETPSGDAAAIDRFAGQLRDADDRRHLLDLAETYRRAADEAATASS